jgi:hypothetical protein
MDEIVISLRRELGGCGGGGLETIEQEDEDELAGASE